MFVRGLGTAYPPRRYTKAECLEAFQSSSWFEKLDRRARAVAEIVLTGDNGIDTRHLALDSLEEVFAIDPDTLHARFIAHAPRLAADAAAKALRDAGLEAAAIDAVVVSTCTGSSPTPCSPHAAAKTCSPCASRSAAPRCISTTIPASWSARACSAMAPARPSFRSERVPTSARSNARRSVLS